MKKVIVSICTFSFLLLLTACDNKEVTYVGVNAEILEINSELNGFVVKGLDENSILGEKCYINCENPSIYFIYVNNETGKTIDLEFDDFVVGDAITVDVNSVENKYALTSRVQLITQRK